MMTHELTNTTGMQVVLVDQGAAIQAIRIPVAGEHVETVLGYDDTEQYKSDPYYAGATLGRFAGRIRDGEFPLHDRVVRVYTNENGGRHCLHGGPAGLHTKQWDLDDDPDQRSAVFRCQSEDGDQGFPGTLDVRVRYSLEDMSLILDLTAVSTADTVVNLSNHAYFNLAGNGSIHRHAVSVNADAYTPIDDDLIPTGEVHQVAGTVFDLRKESQLGQRLQAQSAGFDHNFALNKVGTESLEVDGLVAELGASAFCADTGIRLSVLTTQPGMQFYTGQNLSAPFAPFQALCFEAQGYPNAPNEPAFPSTMLRAGELYRQIIVYKFEIADSESLARNLR